MSRRSSKDQRSDVRNPNSPAYKSNLDNRANQMNPNHAASKSRSAAADRNGENSIRAAQGDRIGPDGYAAMHGMGSEVSPPGRISR
jgi:hypothetical protein